MALNITTLSMQIEAAFMTNLQAPDPVQVNQVHAMSGAIAAAILAFVESATITYTAGLTAPPGGGPVTGIFAGALT